MGNAREVGRCRFTRYSVVDSRVDIINNVGVRLLREAKVARLIATREETILVEVESISQRCLIRARREVTLRNLSGCESVGKVQVAGIRDGYSIVLTILKVPIICIDVTVIITIVAMFNIVVVNERNNLSSIRLADSSLGSIEGLGPFKTKVLCKS